MSIHIGWPEGIYLGLNVLFLIGGVASGKRGEVAVSLAMWVFLTLPLLYWGGFFS